MLGIAQKHLRRSDYIIGCIIDVVGDIELSYGEANFEELVAIIINQQLSDKASATIFRRLKLKFSEQELCAEGLISKGSKFLTDCGISGIKSSYILGLSSHLVDNPSFFDDLKRMDSEQAFSSLTSLRGIGAWSANIFCMFNLRHQDIFPYGDATLEKVMNKLYADSSSRDKIISGFSPYRSIAALYLWKWFDLGQPKF